MQRRLQSISGAAFSSPATATRDELRRALGGVVSGSNNGGRVVRVRLASGMDVVGVTLSEDAVTLDVCVGSERIVRVAAGDANPAEVANLDPSMQLLLHDAREFTHIEAGMSVEYAAAKNEWRAGVVTERCRWGALVEDTADARVRAVSFRRLRRSQR